MSAHFHLALPCLSISETKAFYVDSLGAQVGRSAQNWVDINLYNNQITFTKSGPFNFDCQSYSFGGEILPSFHFGIILEQQKWKTLLNTLKFRNVPIQSEVDFLIEKVGEHHSFFLKDPNDYTVEFKSFTNPSEIFKY